MMRLRNWLSYGNVTATVAVFLAISGTAAAVTLAPSNSVVSGSIKDGEVRSADVHGAAVTGSKVAPDAVSGGKVADGSLFGVDVADGSLTGDDIENGSIGGADVRGLTGDDIKDESIKESELGPGSVGSYALQNYSVTSGKLDLKSVGSRELKDVTSIVSDGVTVNPGEAKDAEVSCPAGQRLIAGGFGWQDDSINSIIASVPNELHPNTGWIARGMVPADGSTNTLYAWANCLPY
jgi:hypothetical protein